MTRLLFVCLGNICRSPTAEGVMASIVAREGLADEIELDSAGTGAWHVGHPPDARATAAAAARGVKLEGVARRVKPRDFEHFDLILAMDRSNLHDLRRMTPEGAGADKIRLLRSFDPAARDKPDLDVPDPYYGGDDGFTQVFDLVSAACEGLLAEIRAGTAG